MFDVIDFLETVGRDAQWRHADEGALAAALTAAQIDSELQMAILAKDGQSLAAKLGKGAFCCYINPGKEDEGDEDDKEEDDEDDKDKDDKGQVRKNHQSGPKNDPYD